MYNFNYKNVLVFGIICLFAMLSSGCTKKKNGERTNIDLNGEWHIEINSIGERLPDTFRYTIPVPGLADMASRQYDSIGYNTAKELYCWYKKHVKIEEDIPGVAVLKISKAKFGTKVYVNGQLAGERVSCFTPLYFNVGNLLRGNGFKNEIIVRVGAAPQNIPDSIPYGYDHEKIRYLPGIYDNVSLIMTRAPWIRNLQLSPDIKNEKLDVVVYLEGDDNHAPQKLFYSITEDENEAIVDEGEKAVDIDMQNGSDSIVFSVPMPDCHLWSPEDPFLYNIEVSTGTDKTSERFGMRTFSFDPETGRALLNGKPYYMRGTNVCIFRFFEDPSRNGLPWDKGWVRKLHQKFKSMHWNSIRYCIGFPPEAWYDIADEVGLLIQDEYPYWNGKVDFDAKVLADEYSQFMQAHWNHPCVVIWDAQNETITDETGKAIQMVRGLDLSNRPWDNGWAPPQEKTDPVETHPYLFVQYTPRNFKKINPETDEYLKYLLDTTRMPRNGPSERSPRKDGKRYPNAIIINEYAWLWLNRDGSTTTLTDGVYKYLFDKDISTEERYDIYARHLGMLTEYWRCHRKCAGILHFCGLGYSRSTAPRGQTSDHFIDIQNLVLEPHFVKYVKPAFSPVGLMIDFWQLECPKGKKYKMPVFVINDNANEWEGKVLFRITGEEGVIDNQEKEVKVDGLGRTIVNFEINLPIKPGDYQIIANVEVNGSPVKSIREITIN